MMEMYDIVSRIPQPIVGDKYKWWIKCKFAFTLSKIGILE